MGKDDPWDEASTEMKVMLLRNMIGVLNARFDRMASVIQQLSEQVDQMRDERQGKA